MKKVIVFLFLIGIVNTVFAQFVTKNGALHLKGTQLVNQNNEPIVLRGMSLGWHCFHPRFYNESVVKWLKEDWKCTVVRAALGVEPGDSAYIKHPQQGLQKIERVVEAAIKNDIYVIIDWHSHSINSKEAIAFFDHCSRKYGKYSNVIFELFNEPDEESWDDVKQYAEEIISVIRKNAPNNIILVGSPHWDQDIHIAADSPLKSNYNIMYTMHFYAGTHGKWLRDRVDYALSKGIPIFVSESAGMEATGDGPINTIEWQTFIDWMEQRKISWITWSVSDKNETCSVLNTSANSNGHWKSKDLKESGQAIRNYLRKFNK
ncbi:MAG: Endoglucanase precursor [Bacteroidota bacterium]|jgi:endoglucanase